MQVQLSFPMVHCIAFCECEGKFGPISNLNIHRPACNLNLMKKTSICGGDSWCKDDGHQLDSLSLVK